MIKINLLETSKGKNKRGGGGAPSMPTMEMGDMGSPKLKVLVVLVLAGLSTSATGTGWTTGESDRSCRCRPPSRQNRELSDVKARYLERQTPGQQLQAARGCDRAVALRARPVRSTCSAMLGETVNGTPKRSG